MKMFYLTLIGLASFTGSSQTPYTENTYEFSVESNIEYGQAINYADQLDTLLMDIYHPIGDDNCKRPCLILVHGGSWIAGSKNDPTLVNIAQSYAEKGWVVAAINYRLGTHKTPTYNLYPVCGALEVSTPCGYIADSAEVFRANYRAQQDAKGAIRFMKNNAYDYSVDVQNVFIAGASAGAFISLAATFLDDPDEKSEFCGAIADAPTPDPDLVSCLPAGYSLARPDLGDINGDLHLGEHDAAVQGVGNFFGGMLNFDMIDGDTEWPVMYMFHQGNDVVVHYNYGRLLGRTDWECYAPTSLCQPYARYPKAYGAKGIETYLAALAESPVRLTEIIENYEYMNDCLDDPGGHQLDNWVTRSDNMANFFAERIVANGNVPTIGPCDLSIPDEQINMRVYPNPSSGLVHFSNNDQTEHTLFIYSTGGQLIKEMTILDNAQIQLNAGIYIIEIRHSENGVARFQKLVVTN